MWFRALAGRRFRQLLSSLGGMVRCAVGGHHSANAVSGISDPPGQDKTEVHPVGLPHYFNNSRMVSGVVFISVIAQRPAPMSFRLAPRR